jgi:hypothetical protein
VLFVTNQKSFDFRFSLRFLLANQDEYLNKLYVDHHLCSVNNFRNLGAKHRIDSAAHKQDNVLKTGRQSRVNLFVNSKSIRILSKNLGKGSLTKKIGSKKSRCRVPLMTKNVIW